MGLVSILFKVCYNVNVVFGLIRICIPRDKESIKDVGKMRKRVIVLAFILALAIIVFGTPKLQQLIAGSNNPSVQSDDPSEPNTGQNIDTKGNTSHDNSDKLKITKIIYLQKVRFLLSGRGHGRRTGGGGTERLYFFRETAP